MKTLKMYPSSINERYIGQAVDELRRGAVILYPTDTNYAIGCDALNNRAVETVCRLKGINPDKQRLSMVCADISQASDYARIDNEAYRIMRANLPGPFTFILPASTRLSKAFKGRKEVGTRVPDNAIARRLAEALGNPLLSATANWEDADPEDLANPEAIADRYGRESAITLMIDGGESPAGTDSAIISLLDPRAPEILREGPVAPADID
ncbi:MAG: L-threonylcarbamoyladenylate synthase [[Clostridium] fimetarium]|nr:L-threonylcarbamoyladenylate synthase [Alistipes timonensis]MCM1405325.1 L-threonylcarbamoyladenylate synthase [[Clostridium] fimetarium]